MSRKIDREVVKTWFFESPHFEWTPFADGLGWNPAITRSQFPVKEWIEAKKSCFQAAALERISSAIFAREGAYHREVLKTLEDLPKLCDQISALLTLKTASLAAKFLADADSVSVSDIGKLATAAKTLIEAKHRSLLIDKWQIEEAEDLVRPGHDSETKHAGLVIQIIGKNGQPELMTTEELQSLNKWYDPPQMASGAPTIATAQT